MKALISIVFFSFLCLMPSAQGADYAYDILVIEASSGKAKPATLAISIMGDKPGEIAFGRMLGESFVGQRLMIRSPDKHTKKVEVVAEDGKPPSVHRLNELDLVGGGCKGGRFQAACGRSDLTAGWAARFAAAQLAGRRASSSFGRVSGRRSMRSLR